MGWGLLIIAGIGLAAALLAVSGGETAPASPTERVLSLGGAVGCAALGFVWSYVGALASEACETNCPPDSVERAAYITALVLAVVTVGPLTVKLAATALTGDLRYARKAWIFVVVGLVAFVAWFVGWGIAFNATRPG